MSWRATLNWTWPSSPICSTLTLPWKRSISNRKSLVSIFAAWMCTTTWHWHASRVLVVVLQFGCDVAEAHISFAIFASLFRIPTAKHGVVGFTFSIKPNLQRNFTIVRKGDNELISITKSYVKSYFKNKRLWDIGFIIGKIPTGKLVVFVYIALWKKHLRSCITKLEDTWFVRFWRLPLGIYHQLKHVKRRPTGTGWTVWVFLRGWTRCTGGLGV